MAKKRKYYGDEEVADVDSKAPSESVTEPEEIVTELPPEPEVGNTLEPASVPEVMVTVTLPPSPEGKILVDRAQFLRHIRRLLIGATDRMVKNGTRRTVTELTGYTQAQANLVVEECKRIKM